MTKLANRSCWASSYSKCKGKISREHLVSAGIFEQKNIFVQGFDWCKENEKEVSVASITSKVFCERHNNSLSDVDQAGIDAIRIFESTLPDKAKSIDTSKIKEYIDGYTFERWLLKIAINISFNRKNHIGVGMADSELGKPSPYLLAIVFGELNFSHKMGLYFLYPKNQYKLKAGSFHVYPIIKENVIGAFVFHIRGMDFLLNLYPNHAPPSLRNLGIRELTGVHNYILDAELVYRSSSTVIINENNEQCSIYFKW